MRSAAPLFDRIRAMEVLRRTNGTTRFPSATPANSPGSWDQFWYGQVWSVPTGAAYKGVIVRTQTLNAPTNMASILDGTSNTLLISEKRLNIQNYDSGDWHDDQGWIDGWDPDIVRYIKATQEWQLAGIGARIQSEYRYAFSEVFYGNGSALVCSQRYSLTPLLDGSSAD